MCELYADINTKNQTNYPEIEELVINLDNRISHRSNRTQFIKRIVGFSRFSLENQLRIRLIYYPSYHIKYNSIERCWISNLLAVRDAIARGFCSKFL